MQRVNPLSGNHNCSRRQFLQHFLNFGKKYGMIFHENHLPADDSHENSYDILMIFHENHLPADDSHEISCLN